MPLIATLLLKSAIKSIIQVSFYIYIYIYISANKKEKIFCLFPKLLIILKKKTKSDFKIKIIPKKKKLAYLLLVIWSAQNVSVNIYCQMETAMKKSKIA